MSKLFLTSLLILGLALAEPKFLGSFDMAVNPEVGNGDSKLTSVSTKNVAGQCIDDLVRIDDLIELLSEFFVNEVHNIENLEFLYGGFMSIRESCVTEFSSPELMDCSNDIEGITDVLNQIMNILLYNPNGDFVGLDPDSLSRAKEICIIPVADDICEQELDANLEDTNLLLRDVYGSEQATAIVILEDATDAARELKTLVYACDNTVEVNEVYEAVRDAILRVLLVIESCHDTFKQTGEICETIDGEELAELVTVFQENGVIETPEEEEGEEEDDSNDLVKENESISVKPILLAQL